MLLMWTIEQVDYKYYSAIMTVVCAKIVCIVFVVFENRCEKLVEKFLNLDLDDSSTDLQSFIKDELLSTIGDVMWIRFKSTYILYFPW